VCVYVWERSHWHGRAVGILHKNKILGTKQVVCDVISLNTDCIVSVKVNRQSAKVVAPFENSGIFINVTNICFDFLTLEPKKHESLKFSLNSFVVTSVR
jgi:hypothetical protein